jgi:phenylacetate-CoA ligase
MLVKEYLKYRLRTGDLFTEALTACEQAEKFDVHQMKEYQEERLRAVVATAYHCVPYYRGVFRERGLTPADIRTVEDLQKLPVIDKVTVRDNFDAFRNRSFHGFSVRGYTGGSAGIPGVFLRDLQSINFDHAALWRQYIWAGKRFGSRRVTLRGENIIPMRRDRPPFWRYRPFGKELVLSSFHLSEQHLRTYVDEIAAFDPFDMYAYPSTAYVLARWCRKMNVGLNIPVVFTSSEVLLEWQRREIEEAFTCKVFDWYGCGERVAAIGQCEWGTYHEIPHYAIMEFQPLGEGKYEIIGTTLHNEVMPLIRYRVGDIVELADPSTCRCGRRMRMIRTIYGREEDLLSMENGRRIIVMEERIFHGLRNLQEVQIVQNDLTDIRIRVRPEDPWKPVPVETIVDRLVKHVGGKRHIYRVEVVDRIERGANGKFKFVKNALAAADSTARKRNSTDVASGER